MAATPSKGYAALAIACLALAVSIYTAVRGRGSAPAATVCVDQEARAQTNELRRLVAAREARIAELAAIAAVPGRGSAAGPLAAGAGSAGSQAAPGPRRYTHFEVPNPAVTVTQKEDGTYDVRTTDPALAGSIMEITAVTTSGEEDKMLVRIPP